MIKRYFVNSGTNNKFSILVILMINLILNIGCENPLTSPGPQPSWLDEHDYQPFLNVFGVLRPDAVNGMPLSFIHLEETFPFNTYPDSVEIKDGLVTVYRYEAGAIIDSVIFLHTHLDSMFSRPEYRNPEFFPQSGKRYGISCQKGGFPELTSETTIPSVPVIIEDTVQLVDTRYAFTIERDSLAELYDIFIWDGVKTHFKRLRRPETGNIDVEFPLDRHHDSEGTVVIYAYDLKLSEYMTYNVSMKPNTYRAAYSTVHNGFGCFGSLNILEKTVLF